MTAFGFGAEEFEDGLSEAVDRARGLLRNLHNLGSESVTRPAGGPFAHEHHEHAEPHAAGRGAHSEPGMSVSPDVKLP